MKPESSTRTSIVMFTVVITAATVILLAVRYTYGYPLFHLLAEVFAVAVATAAFMITWNARRYIDNGYLLVIGVAYLFIGITDVVHAAAYRGMNVFPDATTDLPTQLWLVARYLQAAALAIAPVFVKRRVRALPLFWVCAFVTSALLATVLVWHIFPTAFIEGSGLTPFKIVSEYVIAAVMALGLVGLLRYRAAFDPEVLSALAGSIIASIAAELAFTLYADSYGPANLIGHVLRIVAYGLVYRAIVEAAIQRPYDVLFREFSQAASALAESEVRFRSTFEQATLGIGHISLEGRWLRVNRRLAEMTHYDTEELEGSRPENLTHRLDVDTERRLIERLVSGEIQEYRFEKRILRADASELWVNETRSLVRGAGNSGASYFVSILEDISARKLSEEKLHRSRDLSEALNAVDRALNATLDLGTILQRALSEGGMALRADSGAVLLREGSAWLAQHTWQFREDIIGDYFADDEVPHAVEAARLRAPVAVEDAYEDSRVNQSVMRRFGIRAVITIPLTFRGEDIGTLYFNFHEQPHEFSDEEVDFARKLSLALALAIENARLYEAERSTVDVLRNALVSTEDVARLDIGTVYRSATRLARIGGDFYDMFSLDGSLVAFVLGDVAGKGLEAAAVTAATRSTVRSFAYEWTDPSHVASAANRSLGLQLGESRFVTIVYGVLDVDTGHMRVVCAGHPAPLICSPDRCREDSAVRNSPLGVLPETDFVAYETDLEPGDRIVLFSDGLIDARQGSETLGEAAVRSILENLGDADPQVVADELLAAAESHAGGTIGDDVAILAFRWLGPPSE